MLCYGPTCLITACAATSIPANVRGSAPTAVLPRACVRAERGVRVEADTGTSASFISAAEFLRGMGATGFVREPEYFPVTPQRDVMIKCDAELRRPHATFVFFFYYPRPDKLYLLYRMQPPCILFQKTQTTAWLRHTGTSVKLDSFFSVPYIHTYIHTYIHILYNKHGGRPTH